jgi:3-dehydroquinate dehydratase / shikimate dehydrogenase
MVAQVRLALRETPTVELRLDWLGNDLERMRFLGWLSRNTRRGMTFLATCRRRAGGGLFRGSVAQQLKWLARARVAGCAWCDIEIETLRSTQTGPGLHAVGLPRVLLSAHDFQRTPPLQRVTAILRSRVADGIKIAAHTSTIADSVRMLKFARQTQNSVAVPMGEVGLPARVLALREGSALAYAPVEIATAPGQVSLREFKRLYRAHELTHQTRVYGVIGNPIQHSLSPLLHNTGFVEREMDVVFLPFLVEDLRDFLKAIPEFGIRGFSVTIPHKQSILRHLEECDRLATEIGAVNTVELHDGKLYGSNTDALGILRSLARRIRIRRSRILILGSGGTARAAAFALSREGAAVAICARRESAARDLARLVGGEALPRRALRTERFDAVLNTTPLGMHPHEQISPLKASELHCRIVMDAVYRPERTQLLKLAARKGITTISGVEMFLAQGIAQWELWMKRRAPEQAMRRAVLRALREEARTSPSRRSA